MIVIAAYDVRRDDRRARLAALLQAYGDRVQRSVFVLSIEKQDLDELRARADSLIEHDEDSLYLFRQCSSCWTEVSCQGQATTTPPVLHWAVT